jgi:hypothetical protein
MRSSLSFAALAALLAVSATAQTAFEEPGFNATEALIDLGIDVSQLPSELTETAANITRRTIDGCSIAVSFCICSVRRY